MDGININNFDWTKTLNTMLGATETEGANGVTAKGVIDGESLNITLQDAAGNTKTLTVENPALDPATGEPDAATLEQIQAKLDGLVDEMQDMYKELSAQVSAGNISAASTGTSKVLFDIYQLMSLMIQLAQQQREVARDQRYADLSVATESIQNQADAQRQAAKTGLIMTCCLSAVSIMCTLGMALKSAAASKSAISMEKQVGLDQAQKAYGLSQTRTTADAKSELAKVETKMTPEQIQQAQKHFKTSPAAGNKLAAAQSTLEAYVKGVPDLKARVEATDQSIAAKTTEMTEIQEKSIPAKETELAQTKDALEVKKAELAELGDLATLEGDAKTAGEKLAGEVKTLEGKSAALTEEIGTLKAKVTTLEGEIKGLKADKEATIEVASAHNKRLESFKKAVETAKADYETALNGDMKSLQGELDIAQSELHQAKQQDLPKDEISKLQGKVDALEQQATWGRAHVTHEFHANDMQTSVANGLADCKANFDAKSALLNSDGKYKKAMADAKKYEALSQTVNQLNNVCQSITNYTVESKNAAATEMQKEQKEAEAAREESSDLFSSSKELLDSVLKLMASIQQAENQTMQQIIA